MKQQHLLWQRYAIPRKAQIAGGLVLLLALFSIVPAAVPHSSATTSRSAYPLRHIVIMVKENRTFDNYFGTFPGADGATTYKDPNGQVHPLNHEPDLLATDIKHDHASFLTAYDQGKLDGFSLIHGAKQPIKGKIVDEADSQFYQADIPNYWQYAQTFVLADQFFTTIQGPSFPNHLVSIAAQAHDVVSIPYSTSGKYQLRWGCDAPPGTYVQELHANGSREKVYPCFDFQTLGDLLTARNISWKYYAPGQDQTGYVFSAYDAINHIRNSPYWKQHVVDYTQFAADAAAGTLPTVSWLVQPSLVSDHAGDSVCAGENWTVQQMNPIMQNQQLWKNTAVFLTWDDFGGFYDHVVPPVGPNPRIEYGFRAPLMVISPYADAHSIDHTVYSLSSILKFVETIERLPSLGGLDMYANDLLNAFNFSQSPLPPLVLNQRDCPRSSFQPDPTSGD